MFVIIASAIGRKFYLETPKGVVFLNGYRFLISGPGAGKSLAIKFAKQVLEQLAIKVPMAPDSVTKSSLVDELVLSHSRVMMGMDAAEQVNQTTILASEYGVFIGSHVKDEFYQTMCKLWDGELFRETRRHLDAPIEIKNPYVNMLAGTTSQHWSEVFPRPAWSLGYASRCDFYFSDVKEADVDSFRSLRRDRNTKIEERVAPFVREFAHDIQCLLSHVLDLSNTLGHKPAIELYPTEVGWERFISWYKDERVQTEFKDPWLLDYNARRGFRVWRDAALCCLARGETNFEISEHDFNTSINIHAEGEEMLTDYLYRMSSSEDGDIAKSIWAWGCKLRLKKNPVIPYSILKTFVASKVDQHKVDKIIRYMVDVGAFVETKSYTKENGVVVNLSVPVYQANFEWEGGR